MSNIKITQISEKQAEQFFRLYATIVRSDFKEWTAKTKRQWLEREYSIDYWKQLLSEARSARFELEPD